MAIVVLLTQLPGMLLAARGNASALACLADALSDGGADLPEPRYLLPVRAVLLYVPWQVPSAVLTADSWWDWNRLLHAGAVNDWAPVSERQPQYQAEALTTDWSLVGYDVSGDRQTLWLYWQSPRQYVTVPVIRQGENRSVWVGERFYQEVRLDRQSAAELASGSATSLSAGCPARQSVLGDSMLWESLSRVLAENSVTGLPTEGRGSNWLYTVPVMVAGRFCYFAVVWPTTANAPVTKTGRVVVADEVGAWVLVNDQAPPLPHELPVWDFVSAQVTRGWSGVNGQTFLRPGRVGLTVTAAGSDPGITSPDIRLDARQARRLRVTLRAQSGNTIEVFWATLTDPGFDRRRSSVQRLYADGLWRMYEFDLSTLVEWQGTITRLRLDPTNAPGSVDIASISVE